MLEIKPLLNKSLMPTCMVTTCNCFLELRGWFDSLTGSLWHLETLLNKLHLVKENLNSPIR